MTPPGSSPLVSRRLANWPLFLGVPLAAGGLVALVLAAFLLMGNAMTEQPFDVRFWLDWSRFGAPGALAIAAGTWLIVRKSARRGPSPAGQDFARAAVDVAKLLNGFAEPEDAALASFPPVARARVVRTERIDADRVDVIVDTEPSHPMRVRTEKHGDLWYERGEIVA